MFVFTEAVMLQDSPMCQTAEQLLSMRAFGAPPIVIALAAQGTFQGFKDRRHLCMLLASIIAC